MLLGATAALAHGISDTDRQDMIDGGYLKYIELGADHMLTGHDHLLFLLGAVFFLTKFRDIARLITAFTIGAAHVAKTDEFTSFETTTSDKSAGSLKASFTGRAGSRTFAEVRADS